MNLLELLSDIRSIVTLVSLLTFLGIVWWAYSGRREQAFVAAAHLPFADEQDANSTENNHV